MITFKVNGVKTLFPTIWGEVTYSQYIQLLKPPNSLPRCIHIFTGIPLETLEKAELKNLERISLALSFLTIPPKPEAGPTKMVGPFHLPKDITITSLGQFEDLRGLLSKMPKDETGKFLIQTTEDNLLLSDLYLEACAIYAQKIKDGSYDYSKVPLLKEELKNYSCIEIIQTGAFFLFKPLNLLPPTTTRSQSIRQRLKRLIRAFPGYRKTLDSPQRSLGSPEK